MLSGGFIQKLRHFLSLILLGNLIFSCIGVTVLPAQVLRPSWLARPLCKFGLLMLSFLVLCNHFVIVLDAQIMYQVPIG